MSDMERDQMATRAAAKLREQLGPPARQEPSRYNLGGFEARYVVARAAGGTRPNDRFFVLNLGFAADGTPLDPHAHRAARAYADSLTAAGDNPALAGDLLHMLSVPVPPELAQHRTAA